MLHDGWLARREAQLREAVLVGDDILVHAEEGEDYGDDDAGSWEMGGLELRDSMDGVSR